MSEIEMYATNKVASKAQIDNTKQQCILVEFMEHPWFDLVYKDYIWWKIQLFTDAILSLNPANDDKIYSANYINRVIRNMLIDIQSNPIQISKELAIMENNLGNWEV